MKVVSPASTEAGGALPFAPTFALLCRYDGSSKSTALAGSADLSSKSRLTDLQDQINKLTALKAGQTFNCPSDTGGTIDAFFSKPGGSRVLQFRLSGCSFVSSRHGTYRLPAGSTLLSELKSLTS